MLDESEKEKGRAKKKEKRIKASHMDVECKSIIFMCLEDGVSACFCSVWDTGEGVWDISVLDQAVHGRPCTKKEPSPHSTKSHLRAADYIAEHTRLQLDMCY